jgi:hypothetical protein
MDGWTLHDGIWEGPNGERLQAIAGAQDFGFDIPESAFPAPDFGGGGFPSFDMGPLPGFGGGNTPLPGFGSGDAPIDWGRFFGGSGPSGGGDVAGRGGSSNWLTSIFGNSRGETPSPLAAFGQTLGLGATGLGIANTIGAMNRSSQQARTQDRGQNLALSSAQPAVDYGTDLVNRARSGQLSPSSEAKIQAWTEQAKADLRAKLAHLGLGDSTSLQLYEHQIDQMALSMRETALQQEGSLGISALGLGSQTGLGLAGSGGQNAQMLNDLIAQANRALGLMGARGA